MAEILNTKYKYNVEIYTSNAIDFKALRDPRGRTISANEKYFDEINNIKIKRFPINYDVSLEEKISNIKDKAFYDDLNLSDDCLSKFLTNGPYFNDIFDYILDAKKVDFSLIHAAFFPYFNLIITLIIGKLINRPTICTPFMHFSNPRYLDNSLMEVLNKFDMLIACTNIEKKFIMKKINFNEEKIKVIPMGVDYEKFKINGKRNHQPNYSFKKHFIGEYNTKLILNCAYKNYEKGTLSILKAIPYILEKMENVTFTFIGPSTMAFNRELSRIQKITTAKIINLTPDNLTGYYDKKKISAFQEADLFIMPSRSDAFGIAYLEAWAAGKPVIGANIGATPEVIRDNIDGLLVEFDNPKDIAEKVLKLLNSKKLRKKFGEAGKLRVIQNYTWDIVAEKTHKTYQHLITKEY
jgi:glycosyltransferase involved in cell wall biosynthesis